MSVGNDPTSIGSILLKMGVITEEDLGRAVEEQQRSSVDRQLGNQMVVLEICSAEQVELALAAQKQLRSDDKHDQAMGVADIAQARKKVSLAASKKLQERSATVVKKVTGSGFPAVASGAFAAKTES